MADAEKENVGYDPVSCLGQALIRPKSDRTVVLGNGLD